MAHTSKYLTLRQTRGLEKLGDAYLPGDDELPSFSALGCAEHVDEVLDYLPADDRNSLKLLLGLLSITPRFKLVWLAKLLERSHNLPGPLGGGLRFLRMGLKGLVLTLYYSGKTGANYQGRTPLDVLGYDVGVYTGDLEGMKAAEIQKQSS